ncbi:MAG: hypothetical protein IKX08_03400 [Lachnospiraceae bacterium]|nr:hypothetical protein [Lachnospiraceae bacterium]
MIQNTNDLQEQGYNTDILESIKKHIIVGNVFRIIGIVIFSLIGIAAIALLSWNAYTSTRILNAVYDPCTGSSTIQPSYYYDPYTVDKPNIYLYPEKEQEVNVSLELKSSEMLCMWPSANSIENTSYNWNVTADKNGKIHDEEGNEYSYLFWEATGYGDGDFEKGFCVKGSETGEFLREKLTEIGLTPAEYNEFIVYWLPKMQNNEYNIIRFDGLDKNDAYNQNYVLNVEDANGNKADSMLRVMMVWESSDSFVEIEPQEFETFERNGFTVVEWGGTEIK